MRRFGRGHVVGRGRAGEGEGAGARARVRARARGRGLGLGFGVVGLGEAGGCSRSEALLPHAPRALLLRSCVGPRLTPPAPYLTGAPMRPSGRRAR